MIRKNVKALETDRGRKLAFTMLIDRMLKVGDGFEAKTEGYVPFTPLNIAYRHLDKRVKTILDLGCGKGDPMLFINRHGKYRTVGMDIFPAYLDICREKGSHNELIQQDIREVSFPQGSFDAVLALRVLEHLSETEGLQLLARLEEIARYQVILITPIEDFEQSSYDNNKFQEHRSRWTLNKFKQIGYKTYPNGLKGIQKDSAHITRRQKLVAGMGHILWVISGPVVMIFPGLAANVVAVKNIGPLDKAG